jgi:hypothetical protein
MNRSHDHKINLDILKYNIIRDIVKHLTNKEVAQAELITPVDLGANIITGIDNMGKFVRDYNRFQETGGEDLAILDASVLIRLLDDIENNNIRPEILL